MRTRIGGILFSLLPVLCFAQDEVEEPWGTHCGDIFGTQSTGRIIYRLGEGPVSEAWRLDVRSQGQDRVTGRNPITFDAEGNIYWKTSIGGGTGGIPRVVSASPQGEIRWVGHFQDGAVYGLGDTYDGTAVVIGKAAAYAIGGQAGVEQDLLIVAAFDKETGEVIWDSELPDSTTGKTGPAQFTGLLTPVLYRGKLYVLAPNAPSSPLRNVYRIDAATGTVDWYSTIDEIQTLGVSGQATFVPEAFGKDAHGLYFNGDSGSGTDGVPEVYGIKITEDGAEFAWASEGGKVARSHLIYSDATGLLYAHTWADYGGTLYVYDPVTGMCVVNRNQRGTGHGFYDVGGLDFSGLDIIAGGFEGLVIRYTDDGSGTTTDVVAFDDENLSSGFWGEYRTYGQLLRDEAGDTILITGTNSNTDFNPEFTARVIAINVTKGVLLWEYDTGVVNNHGFTLTGGPAMGPDGKVYFFAQPTGELVALEGQPVVRRSRFIRGDANCTGGNLDLSDPIYTFNFLFLGGPEPCCEAVADTNADGRADISDGIATLNYLFLGGQEPAPPFPDCGEDPGGAECWGHAPCNP